MLNSSSRPLPRLTRTTVVIKSIQQFHNKPFADRLFYASRLSCVSQRPCRTDVRQSFRHAAYFTERGRMLEKHLKEASLSTIEKKESISNSS